MSVRIITGDCRDVLPTLPAESVHCAVTSPPYWGLRDYGVDGQIGLEPTFQEFIGEMVQVFREVRRVLRPDGTLWLNLGDSYANDGKWRGETGGKQAYLDDNNRKRVGREKRVTGLKPKDLCGIPWRVAFALQDDGWWLRQDIIWSKPNPMPESITDRCTKAHEYLFLLTKSAKYHYDAEAIKEGRTSDEHANTFRDGCYVNGEFDNDVIGKRQAVGNRKIKMPDGWDTGPGGHGSFHRNGREKGRSRDLVEPARPPNSREHHLTQFEARNERVYSLRNKRSVWEIATSPFPEAHFATFPPALVEPCVLAGCPKGGTVLDPFGGAGTTGLVADRLQRSAILIELNPTYAEMARKRAGDDAPLFAESSP